MKKLALLALLVVMALSTASSAQVLREIWWGFLDIDPAIELVQSGEPADQLDILAEPTWVNIADNYVARMSGWLTVPETGEYTFYVSGDDYQRLYISQDDDPANAEMVAFVDGWTASQEWTKYESQRAEPMMLEEGQIMAIYGIMQEGGGGDGQDWGWIVPGSEQITLISSEYLSPYRTMAANLSPADGATGLIEAVLRWAAPAIGDDVYDVYFGTDAAALEPLAEGIVETEVFVGTAGIELDFGTTYYWRIDADGVEGMVSSFTTEPMAFAVQNIIATSNGDPSEGSGPEKAINGIVSTEATDQWLAAPPEGEALWIQFELPRVYKMYDVAIFNSNTQFESMLGYGAKDVTIEYSADGEEWLQLGGAREVVMEDPVLIGLAVTSHTSGSPLVAQFSEVATTGDVEGEWTAEAIGVAMPANDAAGLYVAVEDAAGQVAVVAHPDEAATQLVSTQNWNIPLAGLAGVDLANVAKIVVGAGTPDAPATGSGTVSVTISVGTPMSHNVLADVTSPADEIVGVPNDGDWPGAETPNLAFDNDVATKYLHFKGETEPTGVQITPAVGPTVVTGIALTTANDAVERDPVSFELYGSNDGIDGPYTLIASGDVVDFAGETAWPRFTKNVTPITFDNDVAYTSYQILFPAVRDPGSANSMQIAEIELIGVSSW